MKILYVTLEPINSGSSATTCSINTIKGLLYNNHNIDILTISRGGFYDGNRADDIFKKCNVVCLDGKDDSKSIFQEGKSRKKEKTLKTFIKKIYRLFSPYNYSYFYLKKINRESVSNLSKHYDMVISSSDPITSHKAVLKLAKAGINYDYWIQYWGDPLLFDINKKCILPSFILKRLENGILKKADKIVYLSPFTLDAQKMLYSKSAKKMVCILPPSDFTMTFNNDSNNLLDIVYFGIYYEKSRDIMPLYNAVSGDQMVSLKVAGLTDIHLESRSNIIVSSSIPHSEALNYEFKSDVIACILNKQGTQIPAKLYYYMNTNKQILVLYEKQNLPIVHFLEGFKRFVFSENKVEKIREAIEYLKSHRFAVPCSDLDCKHISEEIIRRI